jgi:hypothetical protein
MSKNHVPSFSQFEARLNEMANNIFALMQSSADSPITIDSVLEKVEKILRRRNVGNALLATDYFTDEERYLTGEFLKEHRWCDLMGEGGSTALFESWYEDNKDVINEGFLDTLKAKTGEFFQSAKDKIANVWKGVKEFVADLGKQIMESLTGLWKHFEESAAEDGKKMAEKMKAVIGEVGVDAFSGLVNESYDNISESDKKVSDIAKEEFAWPPKAATAIVESATEAMKAKATALLDGLAGDEKSLEEMLTYGNGTFLRLITEQEAEVPHDPHAKDVKEPNKEMSAFAKWFNEKAEKSKVFAEIKKIGEAIKATIEYIVDIYKKGVHALEEKTDIEAIKKVNKFYEDGAKRIKQMFSKVPDPPAKVVLSGLILIYTLEYAIDFFAGFVLHFEVPSITTGIVSWEKWVAYGGKVLLKHLIPAFPGVGWIIYPSYYLAKAFITVKHASHTLHALDGDAAHH